MLHSPSTRRPGCRRSPRPAGPRPPVPRRRSTSDHPGKRAFTRRRRHRRSPPSQAGQRRHRGAAVCRVRRRRHAPQRQAGAGAEATAQADSDNSRSAFVAAASARRRAEHDRDPPQAHRASRHSAAQRCAIWPSGAAQESYLSLPWRRGRAGGRRTPKRHVWSSLGGDAWGLGEPASPVWL